MDPLQQILVPFGVNIASSAIYDFVKTRIKKDKDLPIIKNELASLLNSTAAADETIKYLQESGRIKVQGSTVFAGSIDLDVSDADEAIGAHVKAPTVFTPGSSITVKTENVKSVTGLKVENIIK